MATSSSQMQGFDTNKSSSQKQMLLATCYSPEFALALSTSLIEWQDITIPTASMLTLNSVPYQLLAAPGAGLAICPVAIAASITYKSATYSTNASGASVKYTDGSGVAPGVTLTQAFLQASASSQFYVRCSTTGYVPTVNAPLMLVAASTDPTTGDSDLKVRVYYEVIPLPLPTY